MEGYDVVTVDEHKVGKVVGEDGNYLIVEQGTLLKSKHRAAARVRARRRLRAAGPGHGAERDRLGFAEGR